MLDSQSKAAALCRSFVNNVHRLLQRHHSLIRLQSPSELWALGCVETTCFMIRAQPSLVAKQLLCTLTTLRCLADLLNDARAEPPAQLNIKTGTCGKEL